MNAALKKIKLTLLDRYLLKEISMPFLLGVLSFTAITAGSSILPRVIELSAKYKMLRWDTFLAFVWCLPEAAKITFLAAALLAALLTFGRLSGDSEITAFRAGGVSLYQLIRAALIFGALVSCLSFAWNELLIPYANQNYESLVSRVSGEDTSKVITTEKVNFTYYEDGYLKQMVYAKKLTNNVMTDVSVIEYQKGAFSKIIFANSAEWQSDKKWLFKNGTVHTFNGSKELAQFHQFAQAQLVIQAKPIDMLSDYQEPHQMNVFALGNFIQQESKGGKNVAGLQFMWNERFAIPFSCFIFVLLGAPMGIRPQRTGSGLGVGLTLLVILGYYGLSSVARALGNTQVLAPFIAAWLPNLVIGALGARMLASKANGFS